MVREITEKKVPDQECTVGIRPEGIVVDEKGTFSFHVDRILTMGRDIMLVATHPLAQSNTKFVVDAFVKVGVGDVKVEVKPHKCFAFSLEEGREAHHLTHGRSNSQETKKSNAEVFTGTL
jgi:ABC-type sugar transport system ATPase subunit